MQLRSPCVITCGVLQRPCPPPLRMARAWSVQRHNGRRRPGLAHALAAALEAAAAQSAIVLSGFADDEVQCLHANRGAIWPGVEVALLPVDAALLHTRVAALASASGAVLGSGEPPLPPQQQQQQDGARSDGGEARHQHGRVMLFLGGPAQQHAADMNVILVEDLGVAPAIIAAAQPKHAELPLAEALASVRAAHAAYHSLVQPAATALAGGSGVPALECAPQLAMNVVLDRGEVPTSTGGARDDESALVVIDGLLSEPERQQLLEWLTSPGHDHAGDPPGDKWERACADRAGDAATWGLRPEVIAALRDDPPPAAVALQARVAALYPEWLLTHMPTEAMLEDDQEQPLSTHVANAVLYGDPCQWHLDADPASLPPGAPLVEHTGYYYNREAGKPLFVTLMAYLNAEWREEWHAETLLADPATGTGVFVQPRPGRVVLMDQDIAHRISAPSKAAPGPRYSLVWKLLLWPRDAATGAGGGSGGGGGARGLSRPEWGPPQRIGSAAAGAAGVRLPLPVAAPAADLPAGN
ncbi:MAG: hypothetical protein J3K34DRAFT_142799 [Monoraphidium minutum]|nr:MAG: hypothetical protein J3K34DRAFT_142799 [Monoraphidium minutum]